MSRPLASIGGFAFCLAPLIAQPPGFRIETVVQGLDLACAMSFAPDGRLFVAERITGHVRVVRDAQLGGAWATVPKVADVRTEAGFLGIAVHPGVAPRQVYVNYSGAGVGTPMVIERYTEVGGVGTNPTRLGPALEISGNHCGGPIVFGRDGKLYIAGGDGMVPSLSQSLSSLHGKVRRMNDDGSVPADNPFASTAGANGLIWTLGHRNIFGLSVHPTTGQLYETENGAFRSDELNRLLPGRNYGWPFYEGAEPTPDPMTEDPLYTLVPEPSYVGAAFAGGDLYPARYKNAWFVGDWKFGKVTLVDLDASGSQVVAASLFHVIGPVFSVADGPDGNIYVLHSVTAFASGADRISRIVHDSAPRPSLRLSAPANRAIGGSLTAGIVGRTTDRVLIWLSFSKLQTPVPTPWGNLWVPTELLLPEFTITGDDRGYRGFPVVDNANLTGQTLYAQAAVLTTSQTLTLTAPAEYRF